MFTIVFRVQSDSCNLDKAFLCIFVEKHFNHIAFRGLNIFPIVPLAVQWFNNVSFQGTCSVELPASNETYTWSNVNCVVHIIGTMWMEHQVIIIKDDIT